MTVMRNVKAVSYKADAAGIGQFKPVKLTASDTKGGTVSIVAAATDIVEGITVDDSTFVGQGIAVATEGEIKATVASGGVTIGDLVCLDSSAPTKIATFTYVRTGATRRQVLGRALESGVENDVIRIQLYKGSYETTT